MTTQSVTKILVEMIKWVLQNPGQSITLDTVVSTAILQLGETDGPLAFKAALVEVQSAM